MISIVSSCVRDLRDTLYQARSWPVNTVTDRVELNLRIVDKGEGSHGDRELIQEKAWKGELVL